MKKVFAAAAAAVLSMNMVFSAFAATKLEAPEFVRWSSDEEARPEWASVDGAGGKYNVEFYQDGQEMYSSKHTWAANTQLDVLSSGSFRSRLEESGTYKFRVMALGDGKETEDSDWSDFSEDWAFSMPDIKFGTVSNLRWNGTTAIWDAPADSLIEEYGDCFDGYDVALYENGKNILISHSVPSTEHDWAEDMKDPDAEYSFSVRVMSHTPSEIFHSEEVFSDGTYDTPGENATVSDTLDSILNSQDETAVNKAPDTLAENISKVQVAMQSDPEIAGKISELEAAYKEQNNVTVETTTSDDAEISGDDIQIVGVGLNAAEANSTVSFNVSKPKKEVVIDHTAYRNTIQVDFSLSGAVKTLKVPVQITLPIPDSINPDFFQILHYHSDGSYEAIMPPELTVDKANMTATFTVTSFSTFVLAEKGADLELVATPSNATEFKNLVDSLPEADDIQDYEMVAGNMAKIREAIQKKVIRAKDMDAEMVEKLDAIVMALADGDNEFSINVETDSDLIDSVVGASLLAYVQKDSDIAGIRFYHSNLATSSNATTKLKFQLKADWIEKDGRTKHISMSLDTPLIFRIAAPDFYDEVYKSTDKISGTGFGSAPIDYKDGIITFLTRNLGTVRVVGQSSSSSSSSSSGRARSGIVKESDLPKSPAGGSWKLTDGKYFYYYSDGTLAKNVWLEINSVWYYFGTDGIMATGWLKDNGNYFYLDPATGAMVTGWKEIDGTWYYFNTIGNGFKGMMLADTTVDGYALDSNGAWIQ